MKLIAIFNKKAHKVLFLLYAKNIFVNNTVEVIFMKKKIFFLVIVLLISISAIVFGNSIDKSLKKIPESAVLL